MKKGWQRRNLGDLCRIRTGKKDVNQGNPDGQFPFFTCAAEHTYSDSFSFDTEALLIAGNGDVGKVSYYSGKFEAYQRTYVLSDFTEVLPRFLYLILDGKLKETVSKQKLGNTIPYIKVGMLTDFQLPVPPLPEQQRIVGILDEAFDGIATAKANAEKNLHNARTLFESYLQSVFTQRGEGWVERRLEDVCVLQRGFDLPTRSRVPGEFPLVSSSGISDTHNQGPIKGPGVATGRSGSIGNVFYIEDDFWPLNTVLYVKEFHGNDPKFIYRLLNHFDLKRFATGAGVPTLNRNFVHDERVIVPESKTVQSTIADQLDGIEHETQRLASIYQRKHAALEALKKSLLHQAFNGEL